MKTISILGASISAIFFGAFCMACGLGMCLSGIKLNDAPAFLVGCLIIALSFVAAAWGIACVSDGTLTYPSQKPLQVVALLASMLTGWALYLLWFTQAADNWFLLWVVPVLTVFALVTHIRDVRRYQPRPRAPTSLRVVK